MNYVWKLLLIAFLIFIISFISTSYIDYKKYAKKKDLEESFIAFENIPRLTKTIHLCSDISKIDFAYTKGDIIEDDHNGSYKSYYICTNLELHRLSIPQVKRLEIIYNIKIL